MYPISYTFAVFLSVLCDNLLLTVVVPILPELLRLQEAEGEGEGNRNGTFRNSLEEKNPFYTNSTTNKIMQNFSAEAENCKKEQFHLKMLNENSQLGILFSTKAIMQLICNPFVGNLTHKIGYKLPLCIGNIILCLCSLVFAFSDFYSLLLFGRTFHGLASSLIIISGMALVAETNKNELDRTKLLGRIMGAAGVGVLIGYPFGGFTYAFIGKTSTFICISLLALFNTSILIQEVFPRNEERISIFTQLSNEQTTSDFEPPVLTTSTWNLMKVKEIKIIAIAILISTMAIAILEPTLPVWLIDRRPETPEWELGLVFVPDSLGYFLGSSFSGEISLRLSRPLVSMCSMAVIGVACFILPLGTKVYHLIIPHLLIGLGLGIVDASLFPLLAKIAAANSFGYSQVYALAQMSVALAYSLGPLFGGEVVRWIGFPNLIRFIGLINILFCPFNLFLIAKENLIDEENNPIFEYKNQILQLNHLEKIDEEDPPPKTRYKRYFDELDSD